MELSDLAKLPIIDCHTHFGGTDLEAIDGMLEAEAKGGVGQVNVIVTSFPGRASGDPQAISAKARHPSKVFWFAGLDQSFLSRDIDHRWTHSLARQVDMYSELGADGLKLINGKPNVRKEAGIALDSVIYDDFFARVEERQFPILWHVNDPEEFWDPAEAPEWAKGPGWLYDDSFPTNESLYQECERVLARHPKLKVIFAHFYFLSDFLDRAAALLECYPNVTFDLAPGIEMLHNFSKRPEAAREFFLKYQDRILFGTDFSPRFLLSRIWVVRNFLETEESFHVPTDDNLFWPDHRTMIRGIKLPEEALRRIYADNFRRMVSVQPKPLSMPLVMAELDRLTAVTDALGASPNMARRVAERLAETR
jgi:predicted TIM-barrel fold metal-dependent hydrolase